MNEAVAVAIQLQVEKRLRSKAEYARFIAEDDNVYFDPFIAKVGRATAPLVEKLIAEQRNIFDDEFVDAYMRAAAAALGPLCDSPRFRLSSRASICGPAGKSVSEEFDQKVRCIACMADWRDLKGWPEMPGVVFLTPADLDRLRSNRGVVPADVVRLVTQTAQTKPKFAYAWQRSPKATLYFLFGRDEARLKEIAHRFSESETPFSGLSMAE